MQRRDGSGLVRARRVPDRRLLLFQGETQVAEVALDVFRPDLYEAGIGDGIAGFQATVPDLRMDDPSFSIRNRAGERLFEAVPASAARKSLTRGPGTPLVPGALPKAEETGHFCADLGAFKLDYHVSEGNSKQLIVFSPGFLDKGRFPHPYFQRMKWAAEFDATCVFLADPTLLLGNTQIGWFLGDAKTHYMPAVADHIGKLAQSRGMTPADVLFFGSSAGGFSSIGFAAHLRGARALAINPQTDALRLHSPTQLAATLRSCFGMENVISARAAHAPRLVLTEMFRALGHVPPMTIWQNAYDRYHVDHHLMPFLDGLRALDLTDSVEVHLAARPEDGHDPPGLPVIRHLFDR